MKSSIFEGDDIFEETFDSARNLLRVNSGRVERIEDFIGFAWFVTPYRAILSREEAFAGAEGSSSSKRSARREGESVIRLGFPDWALYRGRLPRMPSTVSLFITGNTLDKEFGGYESLPIVGYGRYAVKPFKCLSWLWLSEPLILD